MSLLNIINTLKNNPDKTLSIMLPNGEFIPANFHITELAKVTKEFVDCGGTVREYCACVLQVWVANDLDHRLTSTKLSKIFSTPFANKCLNENQFLPVEMEYGENVISRYGVIDLALTSDGLAFILEPKQTGCLAEDQCGIK